MSYSELLKDPRWQRKRLEILARDDWKCSHCLRGDITLHVHHKLYRKGAKPWEYDGDCLTTLCAECHEQITEARRLVDLALGHLDDYDLYEVLGFIRGLCFVRSDDPAPPKILNAAHAHGFGQAFGLLSMESYCLFGRDGLTRSYVQRVAEVAKGFRGAKGVFDIFPFEIDPEK